MTPPIAAMFFNGTLGQFAANSSFGNPGRNSTGQVSDYKQEHVMPHSDSDTRQIGSKNNFVPIKGCAAVNGAAPAWADRPRTSE